MNIKECVQGEESRTKYGYVKERGERQTEMEVEGEEGERESLNKPTQGREFSAKMRSAARRRDVGDGFTSRASEVVRR
jgi:hypothetical protein